MKVHWIFFMLFYLCSNSLLVSSVGESHIESVYERDGTGNEKGYIRRAEVVSPCNRTKYKEWQDTKYLGTLSDRESFWRYQTKQIFVLTNSLALQLAVAACKKRFLNLHKFKAGRQGPISIQDSYKVMCKDECTESDNLHQQAMEHSSCTCLELSTQEDEDSYTTEGDWCRHNSAFMLCEEIGYCGIWNCPIDDFMCPRYEWNKKSIPFKGMGHCIRGAAERSVSFSGGSIILSIILTAIATFTYLL